MYDALGNGIAVGATLIGTGLSNAGQSFTVLAINGKRLRLQAHMGERTFWTFPAYYRVHMADPCSLT